jgi:hypothetical protein
MTAGAALSMSTTIVASDDQISCDVGDETVLLSVGDGEYYGLNPVAASVWRQIREPRSVGDVCSVLLSEYEGISAADCEQAVCGLVGEMLALGIARVR